MSEGIVFKPRDPESGCRGVELLVELSWALNQLMSRILVYFV